MADRSSERSAPEAAIMRATYRALCDHGYADLTMQTIADEYGKTTAAIHYHFDTKEELLTSFLEFLLDEFVATVHEVETTDPEQRLDLLLDQLLQNREDSKAFMTAMLEMRAQAPYNDAIREQFRRNDEYVRYLLRTVIADGIEAGVFADVDAAHAAHALMTIVDGARTRFVVLDDDAALSASRRTAAEYVDSVLRVE